MKQKCDYDKKHVIGKKVISVTVLSPKLNLLACTQGKASVHIPQPLFTHVEAETRSISALTQ